MREYTSTNPTGTVYFLLGDHLGSTSVMTNAATGMVVGQIRYSAYGEERYTSGMTPTDYRYTGQLSRVAEIGLYHYGARWFDPEIAHFVQADTVVPDASNPATFDRFAYTRNNPIRYNDPTGHDVGCSAINPDCLDISGLTERSKVEMKSAVVKKIKNNGWDRVPIVSDVRGIVRGAQVAKWAAEQPEFMKQQHELQSWYDNCYGQCHYTETIKNDPGPSLAGGLMPDIPLVDFYSESMGEIGGNVIDLGLTAITTKITLSDTQVFSHGGTSWHFGLETSKNMNIVHVGNHPEYGTHIAFGAIRPFVADLHIYLRSSFPFFRIWRP